MFVSKEELNSLASMSKLDLEFDCRTGTQPEGQSFCTSGSDCYLKDLNNALANLQILREVDTTGVEPCYYPLAETAAERPDCVIKELTVEEILANAPEREGRFFAVPPAL